MKSKSVAYLVVLLASVYCAGGEFQQRMYYGGYYETNGVPFNGYMSVTLRLFTNNIASTNQWAGNYLYEDTNRVWVTDGFYSAVLGDTTTYGSLTNALASGKAFLEVVANGSVQLPREEFLPVAYAMQAGGVRDDGVTAAAIADGAVVGAKIAEGAVTSYQLAYGAVNSSAIQDGTVTADDLELNGLDGRYVNATGDSMTGPLAINVGVSNSLSIGSTGSDILIGRSTVGSAGGVAVGAQANGSSRGSAVGYQSYAMGDGAAVGYNSRGIGYGAALGREANGNDQGVALGYGAMGYSAGIAVGYGASGSCAGVAIGYGAKTLNGGSNRVVIGYCASNGIDNSAVLRGSLYLDGGTGIFYRSTFGSGAWSNLLTADPRFLRRDGSLPMTGTLVMGRQVITNAGQLWVDGPVLIGTNVTSYTRQAMLVITHTNEITTNADSSVMISSLGARSRNTNFCNVNQKVDFLYRKNGGPDWQNLAWVDGIAIDNYPSTVSPTSLFTYCRRTYSFANPTFEWGNMSSMFMQLTSTGLLVTSRYYGDGRGLTNLYIASDTNFLRNIGGTVTGPLACRSVVTAGGFVNTNNTVTGTASISAGGKGNTVQGDYSAVGGGEANEVIGASSVIGGGSLNGASGWCNGILGGYDNGLCGDCSMVGGGFRNVVNGWCNSIGGGYMSIIAGSAEKGVIGGGEGNEIQAGVAATIPGGKWNVASGDFTFAAGYRAKALHSGSFVWSSGSNDSYFVSTATNQFLVRASGGVGINIANTMGAALTVNGKTKTVDLDVSGNMNLTAAGVAQLWSHVPPQGDISMGDFTQGTP